MISGRGFLLLWLVDPGGCWELEDLRVVGRGEPGGVPPAGGVQGLGALLGGLVGDAVVDVSGCVKADGRPSVLSADQVRDLIDPFKVGRVVVGVDGRNGLD